MESWDIFDKLVAHISTLPKLALFAKFLDRATEDLVNLPFTERRVYRYNFLSGIFDSVCRHFSEVEIENYIVFGDPNKKYLEFFYQRESHERHLRWVDNLQREKGRRRR